MSRTHKTKPFEAKICQGLIKVWEEHDHTSGPCDLPELNYQTLQDRPRSTNCYWQGDYSDPMAFCGCHLCTGHYERKINAKRSRKIARHKTREWVKDLEAYDEEVIEQRNDLWW